MLFLLFATTSIRCVTAQEQEQRVASKQLLSVKSYKVDYEIKGVTKPGNDLLSRIDISKFEYLRQAEKRTEVKDHENQLILILYSETEAAMNREDAIKNSRMKTVTDVKEVNTSKYNPEK